MDAASFHQQLLDLKRREDTKIREIHEVGKRPPILISREASERAMGGASACGVCRDCSCVIVRHRYVPVHLVCVLVLVLV